MSAILHKDPIVEPVNGAQTQTFAARARETLVHGDFLKARELAKEGLMRAPEDEELMRLNAILAPPRVLSTRQISASEREAGIARREANRQWLRAHSDDYRGLWVALDGGNLVGADKTVALLETQVGDLANVFITKMF